MRAQRSQTLAVTGWILGVATLVAARAALLTTSLSMLEVAGWLVLASAPPVIALVLGRAQPSTIAEVLYDAEHPVDAGAPRALGAKHAGR